MTASTRQLKRGIIKDCGCVPRKLTSKRGSIAEDLTGRRFGHLTVIERTDNINGSTAWKCLCDCGNEKSVRSKDLKSEKVKSCGCGAHNRSKPKDLSGRQIGRLTVVYPLPERDYKGSIMWRCRCKCGNERDYSSDVLLHSGTISCGCYRRTMISPSVGLHRLEGTCVERLLSKKARSDSRTGVVGVSVTRNGRYKASIGFQGKRYHLGTFDTIEEATRAREQGEDIHRNFLRWFHDEYMREEG